MPATGKPRHGGIIRAGHQGSKGEESTVTVSALDPGTAFVTTGLDATLRALGVTQVAIAGVATSFGVESTARACVTAAAGIRSRP
jgi:nicotinamidase-related amidase